MRRFFRLFLWFLFALYLGFTALTLALRFWVLPELPRHQPEIEALASRALGREVRLGGLEARWVGLNPGVILRDVEILNAEGKTALRLAQVDGVLSWRSLWSLWQGKPIFAQLSLEKPELLIRRDTEGRIFVAGLPLPDKEKEDERDSAMLKWLLAQRRIHIHDARLIWQDDLLAAPPLVLQSAHLEWRNRGRQHRFGLLVRQPPAQLASALDVRGELTGGAADWQAWRGQIYSRLEGANLPEIHRLLQQHGLDAKGVQMERGTGTLRLWARRGERGWQGTGDVALANARLRLGADLPTLEVSRLQGRLQAARSPASNNSAAWRVASRDLALEARLSPDEAIHIPDLDMQIEWRMRAKPEDANDISPANDTDPANPAPPSPLNRVLPARASVNELDLTQIVRLANALPLPGEARELIARYQPRGVLRQVNARWNPDKVEGNVVRRDYKLEATFLQLGFQPVGKVPGASGLSGKVVADAAGGKLTLEGQQMTLSLPVLFAEPQFPVERLNAQFEWRHNARGIRTEIRFLDFVSPHARGRLRGSHQTVTTGGPGEVDLQGEFTKAQATEVWRYMPRVVQAKVTQWLHDALLAGTGAGSMRLRGNLRGFPFTPDKNEKGEFQVRVQAEGVRLRYGPAWPEMEEMRGSLEFSGGMQVQVAEARSLGMRLQNAQVEIPSFKTPHLLVRGEANASTAEFLRFIEQSPITGFIGNATRDMRAEGAGRLELKLDLPLKDVAATTVEGRYHFLDNQVRFLQGLPPAREVRGVLEITERTVRSDELKGTLLGAPFHLTIKPEDRVGETRKTIHIEASGGAQAQELARYVKKPMRPALSGSVLWQADIRVASKTSEFLVTSTLEGLASTLPFPLAKSAGEAWPLRVQGNREKGKREQIRVLLGDGARPRAEAILLRRADGELERGAVGVGQAPRLPERGLNLHVRQTRLNLDAWRRLLADEADKADGGGAAKAWEVEALDLPALSLVALEAQTVAAFGATLHNASLRLRNEGAQTRIMVAADELVGDIFWDSDRNTDRGGKITADLRRLRLNDADTAAEGGEAFVENIHAGLLESLPGMDIRIGDFAYGKRHFGRLELQAENAGGQWRLKQIVIENPEGRLTGNGLWRPRPSAGEQSGTSNLVFQLESGDSGKLLARLGYPGAVRGGVARLEGNLNWAGSPLDLDPETLDGDLVLSAQGGQFSRIEPGVGKLLGLLSLQSLTRRLSFDFRDIFSEGFAYDDIRAKMHITEGILSTDGNLSIVGPSGRVLMNGRVNMKDETQDLRLTMQPELGGVAAVGAAVAINPLAGAAALLAQRFLQNPLNKVFGLQYAVTGSWSDPKVERLSLLPDMTPNRENAPATGHPGNHAPPDALETPETPDAPEGKTPLLSGD
ncbi:MAG: TIGR02099 family protein [Zoogloeaceae bacterium]|jgi:uncharacterized protein (TIGR02099 family)|nr:TIGR02099 family protein [Zoogloeaceae bacterium]